MGSRKWSNQQSSFTRPPKLQPGDQSSIQDMEDDESSRETPFPNIPYVGNIDLYDLQSRMDTNLSPLILAEIAPNCYCISGLGLDFCSGRRAG